MSTRWDQRNSTGGVFAPPAVEVILDNRKQACELPLRTSVRVVVEGRPRCNQLVRLTIYLDPRSLGLTTWRF
jgi:hypothetical protein